MKCTPVPVSKLSCFKGLELAETGIGNSERITVDILLGLDQYWKFVTGNVQQGVDGLAAQKTIFGWVVSGSYQLPVTNSPNDGGGGITV